MAPRHFAPRFIIKTHTRALRPGNFSILIRKCTYPDKSADPSVVEKRLAGFMNPSTAKYTVLVATLKNRGFGFLLDNMVWSWKGHVINTTLNYLGKSSSLLEDYLQLSLLERIIYSKYFLETEGALLLQLGNQLKKRGKLTYEYLKGEIHNIFEQIYLTYEEIAPDLRTRVRIREMLAETRRRKKSREGSYEQSILIHKIKPHIEAYIDLGILHEIDDGIFISASWNGVPSLIAIADSLNDFRHMEEVFSNDGYFPIIAKAFNLNAVNFSEELHREILESALLYGYETIRDPTTGMAEISAIADWVRAFLLSERQILASRHDVENFLNEIRRDSPSKVRYHVDGKGRIAYVILQP